MTTYCCSIDTRLGPATARSDGRALTGFWFDGQKYFPDRAQCGERNEDLALFAALRAQYAAYERGAAHGFDLPLMLIGTPFQQRVWRALCAIGFGRTLSYGALAESIGAPAAVRAVGAAVGRNPISVIVPCHRVLGASGALTGYAGGIERKRELLAHEGALPRSGARVASVGVGTPGVPGVPAGPRS